MYRKALLVTLVLVTLAAASAKAQQPALTPGSVLEKVVSLDDPSKSYALYLPTSYTPERKFPILYCFDPMARGAVPVTRFKEAAEKFNYILVGSNNSRNGPQPISDIVRNLWDDTHKRFSIDEKRVYLAGFSGGARVATSVGFWLKDRIAGVIACGAGFPTNVPASTPRDFVLFGAAGVEDFNNSELQTLFRALEGSTPPARLTVFDGGHSWLTPELALAALEWFEIQAMRSGSKARDQAWLEKTFAATLTKAGQSKDRYDAYLIYAGAAQDFQGLMDVVELQKQVAELKSTKEVRDGIRRQQDMGEEQKRRVQQIHNLIAASTTGADSLVEMREALREQRKAAEATEPSNRTVAKRVITSLLIEFFELGNNELSQKNYDKAVSYYSICTEIQPENARAFYNLGRAYALKQDRKKAISALQTAAEKGLASPADLAVADFASLQSEKRFQEILELVKQNQSKLN